MLFLQQKLMTNVQYFKNCSYVHCSAKYQFWREWFLGEKFYSILTCYSTWLIWPQETISILFLFFVNMNFCIVFNSIIFMWCCDPMALWSCYFSIQFTNHSDFVFFFLLSILNLNLSHKWTQYFSNHLKIS